MSKSTVLIVEDESIIALDIKISLLNAGYEVVATAAFGEEAIRLAATYKPDLILMDIRLQGAIDGIEAATEITNTSPTAIVFLTAHADKNTLNRAKSAGPFGYLVKPFEENNLITTIEIALARHQAEVAIRESLRQQQIFNQVQARFLALMSHEFRNPLNSILFSSELLERYGNTVDLNRRSLYFQRIHGAVHRMNQLLDDVLTLGEADAGKLDCNPAPIDLQQFCQELLSEIQPEETPTCPVKFVYEVSGRSQVEPTPYLDRKLLGHILGNLLSNAVKYSIPGVAIMFQVSVSEQAVLFTVQDRGIGIPEADLDALFSDFHRARNVKAIPGTGLGLSIVKQCVEIHGGTVEVESIENQGSTFRVTLPIAPIASQPAST